MRRSRRTRKPAFRTSTPLWSRAGGGDYDQVIRINGIPMARADPTPAGFGRSLLALNLSANAVETARERCERAANVEAAIEACSSVIQTDNDHHRLAMAYFNRAGWLKKDDVNRAASDLSEAIGLEPDFAAALTKRELSEERRNDLRSARADFAAVLKLPTTNSLSAWAHAMARERLAATEAAAAKSAAASNPQRKLPPPSRVQLRMPPRKLRIGLLQSSGEDLSHRFSKNVTRSHPNPSSFRARKVRLNSIDAIGGASICRASSRHC